MGVIRSVLLVPLQLLHLVGWLALWLLRWLFGLLARIVGLGWQKQVRTGEDYEQYVQFYLSRHGFRHIRLTGGTGDLGVDLVARRGRHTYAVQCKFYSYPVGGAAVQEVVAGMPVYHCDAALLVTNSTLTRGAWTLAERNGVEVLEHICPENDTDLFSVQRLITPKNLVAFALGWVAFGVLLSRLSGSPAVGVEGYVLLAVGCLLGCWAVLTAGGWLLRRLFRRRS
jgi:restriction system protein